MAKRGRPRKDQTPVSAPEAEQAEAIEETTPAPEESELYRARCRQDELLTLRNELVRQGIDSISKLDVLLGQANEEVRRLL